MVRKLLSGVLLFALFSSPAHAQVKPKVMIIFDTSGSMLSNDRDGSPLCNNRGTNSRIYQLKVALFDVLQGIGATEMDFALATFPQMVDPNRNRGCPNGHYYDVSSQDSEIYGSSRGGCKISSHLPKQTSHQTGNCKTVTCPWYGDYKKEVLKVPFGQTPETVMYYFDQKEDHPLKNNPEIRAYSWTPLGKSLFYAHGYFHREVALPANDYRKKCERLVVALFTDGEETCNPSSSNAFYPRKWAANMNTNIGVVTHTVAIDTSHSLLSQIASSGKGKYYRVGGNTAALKAAFLDIIASSQPPTESCNNVDDDCDKLVDEDFPLKGKPCNNGLLGTCFRTGTYVCKADGSGVVCKTPTATPGKEICNNKDDNCNGQIDEIPGCQGCVIQPEVCNGIDDDCDGTPDDNLPTSTCGVNVGECKTGTADCVNGKSTCKGGTLPTNEICDNKDNNCDGIIDGIIETCYPPNTAGCDPKTGICKGQCKMGSKKCTTGSWGTCQGFVGPGPEKCDGVDNNCDGVTDEKAECPGGSQCIAGQCTLPCSGNEFVCPTGQYCKNGWCVGTTCDVAACKAKGGVCKAGECVDLCKDVTCGKLSKCVAGQCVDDSCYQAHPCTGGKICAQGVCVEDPCKNHSCSDAQFCQDGKCIDLCSSKTCAAGQTCKLVDEGGTKRSKCVDDLCANKDCGANHICIDGKCEVDPCEAVTCGAGEFCLAGKCHKDTCETTQCPTGFRCERGNCVDFATKTNEVLATGAGGCSCTINAVDPASALPFVLFLAFFFVIRRRW